MVSVIDRQAKLGSECSFDKYQIIREFDNCNVEILVTSLWTKIISISSLLDFEVANWKPRPSSNANEGNKLMVKLKKGKWDDFQIQIMLPLVG